ncbi:MAG: hypothetical protein N2999_02980 [Proteobacteria bacterium]|nr:hypothetical protein [Pseudomonadota bacterium]
MPEITFLRVNIGEKIYLFDEKIIAKVTAPDSLEIFSSPYGKNLPYVAVYNKTLIPLFSVNADLSLKDRIVLIVIKILDLAGVIIDNFIDFIKINEEDLKNAIVVDDCYAKRALKIGEKDCYFFDEMSLFSGEESL